VNVPRGTAAIGEADSDSPKGGYASRIDGGVEVEQDSGGRGCRGERKYGMKAASKLGLLLAVALVACTAMAVGAQAQVDIKPDNTDITGTATNPTLDYEGTTIQCNTGTAVGTTDLEASDIVNVELEFFGNCNVGGLGATVTCSDASGADDEIGTARLQATNATTNDGIVEQLNSGFSCDVVVAGICTVSVDAQELPITGGNDQADLLNEGSMGSEAISANVDVTATNDNTLCGPTPSGVGNFTGVYDLGTTAVRFD
jgi:hypothetical protein